MDNKVTAELGLTTNHFVFYFGLGLVALIIGGVFKALINETMGE